MTREEARLQAFVDRWNENSGKLAEHFRRRDVHRAALAATAARYPVPGRGVVAIITPEGKVRMLTFRGRGPLRSYLIAGALDELRREFPPMKVLRAAMKSRKRSRQRAA